MTLGLQGDTSGRTLQIRLAEEVGAGGLAAPTLETDGFDLRTIRTEFKFNDRGTIMIHKASGTTLEIASARLWGFYYEHLASAGPSDWGPMGYGTAADRGKLNLGAVIAEPGRKILLLQDVDGLRAVERIAVSLGAITGDLPVVHVDLILVRRDR